MAIVIISLVLAACALIYSLIKPFKEEVKKEVLNSIGNPELRDIVYALGLFVYKTGEYVNLAFAFVLNKTIGFLEKLLGLHLR